MKALKPQIERDFKVEKLGLFGSFARQEQTERSDIDILVRFREGADLLDLTRLKRFLEEKLGRKVDGVSEGALEEEFRNRVLSEVVAV